MDLILPRFICDSPISLPLEFKSGSEKSPESNDYLLTARVLDPPTNNIIKLKLCGDPTN